MGNITRGIMGALVRNPVFANLLSAAMIVGGVLAAFRLPRETFPETSVNYAVVSVVFPGAGPEEVEESVCVKIEQAVEGIPGVWEVSSISEENVGHVGAAFDPSITPAAEVLRQVQNRVDAIATFPPEVERPIVFEGIIRNPVISIGVHGDATEQALKKVAEQIERELLASPEISLVRVSGVRDYEISIKIKEETLQQFGLTLQQVIDVISRSSLDLPAGTIRTRHEEIAVRTLGQRYTAADFEDLIVIAGADGGSVRLGQLAVVRDSFEETPVLGRVNGKPGATVHVSKTSHEDISRIAAFVRDYVDTVRGSLPQGVELTLLADRSRDVDARINMLLENGYQGLLLVLICLILFLDLRSAFGVALGIPISYAGSLAVIALTGASINMISMLGLLLTSGIIVDDSIVVADAIRSRSLKGMKPEAAAIEGAGGVARPVLNASFTIVIMFMPLMFVEGVMGKFIYILPLVVIASVVASGVEVFAILPAHLAEWAERAGVKPTARWRVRVRDRMDGIIGYVISRLYRPLLSRALAGRYVVLGGSFAMLLICAGLFLGGRAPFVLFPKMDVNNLRARIRFPAGTPAEVSLAAVQRVEEAALALNDDPSLRPAKPGKLVQQMTSTVGEWPDLISKHGAHLSEITIELMPAEEREVNCAEVMERWRRKIGYIPDAETVNITREELGPTEKPLEIRLLGDDLIQLRAAANHLEETLRDYAGVFDVDDDLVPGKRELRVSLKPSARNLGLTLGDVALQLRQGLYGGEALRVQRGRDEVKVVVSYIDSDRRSMEAVENLRIRTRAGEAVPFTELAETELIRGYASIGRQGGQRRIRVQADVDERHANTEQIVQNLEADVLPGLIRDYPGVTYVIDGERKRISESVRSLFDASLIALAAVFALLGATLKSYVQPLIIMAAIPLGLVGCVLGHAVMGYELTLMSLFGMVALSGIVVNDSIVLVDRMHQNICEGMGVHEAVASAGESRFLAVFLTAVTDMVGLLPLLTERSSQAQSLIPMAISIAFGLCFAAAMTLIVVPALYLSVNDLIRFAHWLRHGGPYPTREKVDRSARYREESPPHQEVCAA